MKIHQHLWEKGSWQGGLQSPLNQPQLILAFGATDVLKNNQLFDDLKQLYPNSHILICSTAGEIAGTSLHEHSLVVTALQFEKTTLQFATTHIDDAAKSKDIGKELATKIPQEGLIHTLVFSEGLKVNGTALIQGINETLPPIVAVTGGLVGDGADFKETLLGLDTPPSSGNVILIGLYSTQLKVGYGSLGGWDPFGPERLITKSNGHILYELDGKNALTLYKEYLGEKAKELPASGLLFPLELTIKTTKGEVPVVRTLLAINEQDQSMTFAGDMPEGVYARLMKANFDRLINGAGDAANMSVEPLGQDQPELAILISCIGRKLVLGARVEEELSAVARVLGQKTTLCGFYSYGEICPTTAREKQCQLHNQTMTITTLRET